MTTLGPLADAWLRVLADHLWQSTWVALGATLLAFALRRQAARYRAAVWLAAALKFLVPFAALVAAGRLLPLPVVADVASPAARAVEAIGQPFTLQDGGASLAAPASAVAASSGDVVAVALLAVWIGGTFCLVLGDWVRWRRVRALVTESRRLLSGREVEMAQSLDQSGRSPRMTEIRATEQRVSPSVVGFLRPVVLWPAGLSSRLSDDQLRAILAHELCHVRRLDGLAAAVCALVRALVWFHPLVWWLGVRRELDCERACDEHVLAGDASPVLYATGILKVCEFSVPPFASATAGVTGASLTKRIEAIMTHRTPGVLSWWQRAPIVATALLLVIAPVATGAMSGDAARGASAVPPIVSSEHNPQGLPPGAPPSLEKSGAATEQAAPQVRPAPIAGTPATAQPSRLAGVVTDFTGATVAGARVTVTGVPGAASRTAESDADGRFVVTNLAPGDYDLRVEMPAFRTFVRRGVSVGVTTESAVRVELALGGVTEVVDVRVGSSSLPAGQSDQDLQSQLARDPENATTYFDLARLYYSQERFADSTLMVSRAIELMARRAAPPATAGGMAGLRGGDIRPPRKIRDVRAVYPSAAPRINALVILEARIGTDGAVHGAKVLRSIPGFDESALGAVRQWLFTPTLLNGAPVEVTMTVTVSFLSNE